MFNGKAPLIDRAPCCHIRLLRTTIERSARGHRARGSQCDRGLLDTNVKLTGMERWESRKRMRVRLHIRPLSPLLNGRLD